MNKEPISIRVSTYSDRRGLDGGCSSKGDFRVDLLRQAKISAFFSDGQLFGGIQWGFPDGTTTPAMVRVVGPCLVSLEEVKRNDDSGSRLNPVRIVPSDSK